MAKSKLTDIKNLKLNITALIIGKEVDRDNIIGRGRGLSNDTGACRRQARRLS